MRWVYGYQGIELQSCRKPSISLYWRPLPGMFKKIYRVGGGSSKLNLLESWIKARGCYRRKNEYIIEGLWQYLYSVFQELTWVMNQSPGELGLKMPEY